MRIPKSEKPSSGMIETPSVRTIGCVPSGYSVRGAGGRRRDCPRAAGVVAHGVLGEHLDARGGARVAERARRDRALPHGLAKDARGSGALSMASNRAAASV